MKPKRPAKAELWTAAPIDQRAEDAKEMAARQELERAKLEQKYSDAALALESQKQAALTRLERDHLVETAKLWKRQGRKLGPAFAALLEGGR